MNEILQSLKSDLLDRRLLPILLALGLALAGAIAYVVLASGGSSGAAGASRGSVQTAPISQGPALAVSEAPADPNAAVAETTNGTRYQHKPGSHNPFTPLAAPKASAASTSTSGGASSSGGSSVSSSGSSSSTSSESSKSGASTGTGGSSTAPSTSTSTTPAAPKPKPKPKPVYLVTVQFGLLPSTPTELSQLTPYSDLKPHQPLPSVNDSLIVFAGARGNGKGAVFTLVREAILKGQAICVPSTSQCEAIDLAVGQSEELNYLEPDGQSVPYELKVVSIDQQEAATATTARRHRRHHHRHHHE
jgi:hypothetical protein